jgi:hypothetical protein
MNPYQQGGNDYCVSYGLANALSFADDAGAAGRIANLAAHSIKAIVVAPLNIVQGWCLANLQPAYSTVKLKNAHTVSPLLLNQDHVTVMQFEDDRNFCSHTIATYGGYIFDSNKTHPSQLTKEGLDASCFHGARFTKIIKAFQLIPSKNAKRKRSE